MREIPVFLIPEFLIPKCPAFFQQSNSSTHQNSIASLNWPKRTLLITKVGYVCVPFPATDNVYDVRKTYSQFQIPEGSWIAPFRASKPLHLVKGGNV